MNPLSKLVILAGMLAMLASPVLFVLGSGMAGGTWGLGVADRAEAPRLATWGILGFVGGLAAYVVGRLISFIVDQ